MLLAEKTAVGRVKLLENTMTYYDLILSPSELKTIGVCRGMEPIYICFWECCTLERPLLFYFESFMRIGTELMEKKLGNLQIERQPKNVMHKVQKYNIFSIENGCHFVVLKQLGPNFALHSRATQGICMQNITGISVIMKALEPAQRSSTRFGSCGLNTIKIM